MPPHSDYVPLHPRQVVLPLVTGLALVFLLSLIFTGSAAAAYVTNTHARWYTAQTSWGTPLGEVGDGASFFAQVPVNAPPEQPLVAEYSAQQTTPATCDAGTPGDASDDWAGAAGTVVEGMAWDPTVTGLTSRLDFVLIEGTLSFQAYSVDACGNATPHGDRWEEPFRATIVGVGRRSGWHDSWHEGVPSEWLSVGSMTSRERRASGSLVIGSDELFFDPSRTLLALNRLNSHESGR